MHVDDDALRVISEVIFGTDVPVTKEHIICDFEAVQTLARVILGRSLNVSELKRLITFGG